MTPSPAKKFKAAYAVIPVLVVVALLIAYFVVLPSINSHGFLSPNVTKPNVLASYHGSNPFVSFNLNKTGNVGIIFVAYDVNTSTFNSVTINGNSRPFTFFEAAQGFFGPNVAITAFLMLNSTAPGSYTVEAPISSFSGSVADLVVCDFGSHNVNGPASASGNYTETVTLPSGYAVYLYFGASVDDNLTTIGSPLATVTPYQGTPGTAADVYIGYSTSNSWTVSNSENDLNLAGVAY